jgi:copper chaperone
VIALLAYTPPRYEERLVMCDPLTYRVDGMTCDHCRAAVTEQVSRVPGVAAVDVDLEDKLVRVSGHPLEHDALVAAIQEAGYEATLAS